MTFPANGKAPYLPALERNEESSDKDTLGWVGAAVGSYGWPPSMNGIEFMRLGRQDRSNLRKQEWGLGSTEAYIWQKSDFKWEI
jgi:hypothetical protein